MWGITRLRPDQLEICIEESHTDARILPARPIRGSSRRCARWHAADGHFIHVTSHRALAATRDRALAANDRVAVRRSVLLLRAGLALRELQIDAADRRQPANLAAALEHGLASRRSLIPGTATCARKRTCSRATTGLSSSARSSHLLSRQGREIAAAIVGRVARLLGSRAALLTEDLRRRDAARQDGARVSASISSSSPPGPPRAGCSRRMSDPRTCALTSRRCRSVASHRARARASSRRCALCSTASASTA